ncbi:hypothetical protein H0H92_011879 [Tricholoma furcatifolium]|nr:hypothetical protein H0H92_011879 [Tricholoma furcatifolium]
MPINPQETPMPINPQETPVPINPKETPGSDLEPMDPTSPAFKDQLRAKLEDYKRKYNEELHQWTFEEKVEWWEKQPPLPPRENSILPEFINWIENVYRKSIPESEDRHAMFDKWELEALADNGW